jgi:hypothetical protein
MTRAEKCKKRQKKENHQSMDQELFSSSTSTRNNNSAPDKMQQRSVHMRGARDKWARVRKKSARECASFPRFQLVCVTQPHGSRARPPLSMYATRISEPAGAINEEEMRLTFSSVSKAQKKTTRGLSHGVALPFTLKKKYL